MLKIVYPIENSNEKIVDVSSFRTKGMKAQRSQESYYCIVRMLLTAIASPTKS